MRCALGFVAATATRWHRQPDGPGGADAQEGSLPLLKYILPRACVQPAWEQPDRPIDPMRVRGGLFMRFESCCITLSTSNEFVCPLALSLKSSKMRRGGVE